WPGELCLGEDRLEGLDGVAGGILDDDLPAAGPGDDVVAEPGAVAAQFLDSGSKVGDLDTEAIPAAGLLHPAVGHRRAAPGWPVWADRPDEHQAEVTMSEHREQVVRAHLQLEVEAGGVEVDRGVDVVDDVTDADGSHRRSSLFSGTEVWSGLLIAPPRVYARGSRRAAPQPRPGGPAGPSRSAWRTPTAVTISSVPEAKHEVLRRPGAPPARLPPPSSLPVGTSPVQVCPHARHSAHDLPSHDTPLTYSSWRHRGHTWPEQTCIHVATTVSVVLRSTVLADAAVMGLP